MAHRNILQIRKEPFFYGWNHFDSSRYYGDGDCGWFFGSVCDSIEQLYDEERDEPLCLLSDKRWGIPGVSFEQREVKENENDEYPEVQWVMTIVSKEEYFKEKYKKAKELATSLANMSFETFSSLDGEMTIIDFENLVRDKGGYYVDDDYEFHGCVPFDTFMREVNDGDEYYIGAVMDFHY